MNIEYVTIVSIVYMYALSYYMWITFPSRHRANEHYNYAHGSSKIVTRTHRH